MSTRVKVQIKDPRKRRKIRGLVLRLGLDRRRVYTQGMMGELAILGEITRDCSGCACDCCDGMCSHGSHGCEECGYTGKRREMFPEPVMVGLEPGKRRPYQIAPYYCVCGRELEHFDAGCEPCHKAVLEGESW